MKQAYDNAMRQYGTGSDLQKAAQAVTGALTALAGNNRRVRWRAVLRRTRNKNQGDDYRPADERGQRRGQRDGACSAGRSDSAVNNQSAAAGGWARVAVNWRRAILPASCSRQDGAAAE